MVAVAAGAAHEGLPVVVQRLEPAGRRAVFGEREDLFAMFLEGLVEAAKRSRLVARGTEEDPPQSLVHRCSIGCGEDLAELLLDLVAARERAVVVEHFAEASEVAVGVPLPGAEEKPSTAAPDRAQLGAGAEEDVPPKLVEHLAGERHD